MSLSEQLYKKTSLMEEYVILAYAVVIFLPITLVWIVLISGISLFVLRTCLEAILIKQGKLPGSSGAACSTFTVLTNTPSLRALREAPLTMPLLFYSVAVLVTGLCAGGIKEALSSVSTLRAFLVYFVAYRAFSASDALVRRTLLVLLCAGAVNGLWGTIQKVFKYHPFDDYQYLQATGFIGAPMAYAGQMEVMACLALALLLTGGHRVLFSGRHLALVLPLVILNVSGAVFAFERSAWLGLFAGVLVLTRLVSLRLFLIGVVTMALAAVIGWFCVPDVQARIGPLLKDPKSDISVKARLSIWKTAGQLFCQHPIVGVGVRNFPKLDMPEAIVKGESTHLVHAHSNPLHILSTMGLVGFVSYLYMQIAMLFVAFKNWRQPELLRAGTDGAKLQSATALGVLAGVVSLMVAGLFEYNFGTGHVRLMHWFVLGMLLSNVRPGPGQAFESPGAEQTHDRA